MPGFVGDNTFKINNVEVVINDLYEPRNKFCGKLHDWTGQDARPPQATRPYSDAASGLETAKISHSHAPGSGGS
jgi:hypothetical protein